MKSVWFLRCLNAYVITFDLEVHEGLAVFSRFPIAEYSKIKLSQNLGDDGDFHQRIALNARIVWGSDLKQTLHVITTHLYNEPNL